MWKHTHTDTHTHTCTHTHRHTTPKAASASISHLCLPHPLQLYRVFYPNSEGGLPSDEITIPQVLKQAKYSSKLVSGDRGGEDGRGGRRKSEGGGGGRDEMGSEVRGSGAWGSAEGGEGMVVVLMTFIHEYETAYSPSHGRYSNLCGFGFHFRLASGISVTCTRCPQRGALMASMAYPTLRMRAALQVAGHSLRIGVYVGVCGCVHAHNV